MKGESEQSGARQWPRQSGRALGVTFSAVTVFALLALGGVLLRSLAGLGQEAEQQPPGAQPALCPKRAAISVGFSEYPGPFPCFYLSGESCALEEDGEVVCWDATDWSELSWRPEGHFREVAGGGGCYTCALSVNGEIVCQSRRANPLLDPTPPEGYFTQVAVGEGHGCGVRRDGRVRCWGFAGFGTEYEEDPEGLFLQVSAGRAHACALRADGRIVCWGRLCNPPPAPTQTMDAADIRRATRTPTPTPTPELGAAATPLSRLPRSTWPPSYPTPTPWLGGEPPWSCLEVPDEGPFVQVSAGSWHTCALRADGRVACWGRNHFGQASPPAGRFVQVTAGGTHSCGLRADGFAECWGQREFTVVPRVRFVQIAARGRRLTPGRGIYFEDGGYTCGITTEGEVLCWPWVGMRLSPVGPYRSVALGPSHDCGVRQDGVVECRGSDEFGEATAPPGSFVQVAVGDRHSCAIREDGQVQCWGSNELGEATPPEGVSAVQLSAGPHYTCALGSDGAVRCWGSNEHGAAVPAQGQFVHLATGETTACGVSREGRLRCWGARQWEQELPQLPVLRVALGWDFACALTGEGRVLCAGSAQGFAPEGTFTELAARGGRVCALGSEGRVICWEAEAGAFDPAPPEAFQQVAVSAEHSCAIRADGTLECWGRRTVPRSIRARTELECVPRHPAGDCNGDGQVEVDELVLLVNIALGQRALEECSAGDSNEDGVVTVEEIVAAVAHALEA